jgi:excisionase family DNA binding protein
MLYNKKSAARLLSVSVKTLDRAIIDGRLKCRRIGAAIRFTQDDLDLFIGGRVMADAEKPVVPENRQAVPREIIKTFEKELAGISHGSVTLTVHFRDGKPRFVIGRERSFLQGTEETVT